MSDIVIQSPAKNIQTFKEVTHVHTYTLSVTDVHTQPATIPQSRVHCINLLMGLNVYSSLLRIRDGGKLGGGGVGGMDIYVLPPTRYTVTTRMTALRRAAV